MRRLLIVVGVALATLAALTVPADATVTGHYGHRNIYYTYNGYETNSTSSDADVRVGLEVRELDGRQLDAVMVVQVLDAWNVEKVCAVRSALHYSTGGTALALSPDVPTNCTESYKGGSVESSTSNRDVRSGSHAFVAKGRFRIWMHGCNCAFELTDSSYSTPPWWDLI